MSGSAKERESFRYAVHLRKVWLSTSCLAAGPLGRRWYSTGEFARVRKYDQQALGALTYWHCRTHSTTSVPVMSKGHFLSKPLKSTWHQGVPRRPVLTPPEPHLPRRWCTIGPTLAFVWVKESFTSSAYLQFLPILILQGWVTAQQGLPTPFPVIGTMCESAHVTSTAADHFLFRPEDIERIVAERQHRLFTCRSQLQQLLPPATYNLAVGFLRISVDVAENPLDATGVHPEGYPIVERVLRYCGRSLSEIWGNAGLLQSLDLWQFVDVDARKAPRMSCAVLCPALACLFLCCVAVFWCVVT